MLLNFQVANHKSIRTEQELDLRPVYDRERPALPVVAVYGGNASGKSNLVDAMAQARRLSSGKSRFGFSAEFGSKMRTAFKLDPTASRENTDFVLDVDVNGVLHQYGLAVDDEVIRREWLYSYPNRRKRVLFERKHDRVEVGSSVKGRRALQTLAERTRADRPVLAGLNHFRVPEWEPAAAWMHSNLHFAAGTNLEFPPGPLVDCFDAHPELTRLAKAADLGIRHVEIRNEAAKAPDSDLAPESEAAIRRQVVFHHDRARVPLKMNDESEGTLNLIRRLAEVLEVLDSGGTLIADDFETNLHPRMLTRVVELFHDRRTNPKNAQLIFTTHDVSLLGSSFGEPILRRDEVWFTEKNEDGETLLFPLIDYKPRKGENTEKRYLGGSYGAVPAVYADSLVDALLDAEQLKDERSSRAQSPDAADFGLRMNDD